MTHALRFALPLLLIAAALFIASAFTGRIDLFFAADAVFGVYAGIVCWKACRDDESPCDRYCRELRERRR